MKSVIAVLPEVENPRVMLELGWEVILVERGRPERMGRVEPEAERVAVAVVRERSMPVLLDALAASTSGAEGGMVNY